MNTIGFRTVRPSPSGCVLAMLIKGNAMTRVRIFTVFLMAILAGGGLAYGTYDYLQNVPARP